MPAWLKTFLKKTISWSRTSSPAETAPVKSSRTDDRQRLVASLDDLIKTPGKASYEALTKLAATSTRDEFINFVHCQALVGARVREGELMYSSSVATGKRQRTQLFHASMLRSFIDGASLEHSIFLLRKPMAGAAIAELTRFTIGRDPSSDVLMMDFAISREHAMVEIFRDRYVLTDLGSANGTFVGGIRLERGNAVLSDGDHVRFGRYEFLFLGAGGLFDLLRDRSLT